MDAQREVTPNKIYITGKAFSRLNGVEIVQALEQHCECQWGDVSPSERRTNDRHIRTRGRVLSRFESECGGTFYVVTGQGWVLTTVLLAEEFEASIRWKQPQKYRTRLACHVILPEVRKLIAHVCWELRQTNGTYSHKQFELARSLDFVRFWLKNWEF